MTLKEQDKVQKYGAGNALILQELPVRTESPDIRYKRHGKRRTGEAMSFRERMDEGITSLSMQALPLSAHIHPPQGAQPRLKSDTMPWPPFSDESQNPPGR